MSEKDLPFAIIIFLPLIILLLETFFWGLSVLWDWFIVKDKDSKD